MMTNIFRKAALAATFALGMAGMAQAATCTIAGATLSTACAGPISGNDKDTNGGNGVTNVNDIDGDNSFLTASGLFGIATWTESGRIDNPGTANGILSMSYTTQTSGGWEVTSWAGIGSAMLVVKASNEFVAYLLDITNPLVISGTWTTASLTNKNGKLQDISHLTLYTTRAPVMPPVPLPAGLPLLLAGLGALALVRRRKA